MTTLLLAICGPLVVIMVVAGMILITPSGTVDVHVDGEPSRGSNLSPVAGAEAGERAGPDVRPARPHVT